MRRLQYLDLGTKTDFLIRTEIYQGQFSKINEGNTIGLCFNLALSSCFFVIVELENELF